MTFWIVFGIIIGLVGLLALASKIKHGKQKIKATVQSTKSDKNVYRSKSTKSNTNLIKTSPIGDVHLINYKHVVNKKNQVNYMNNHKGEDRFVAIVGVNKKEEAKIADLITIKKTHKNDIRKGRLIVLNDYSTQRGKATGMSKKQRSIDFVNNSKFKVNKTPLNRKVNKLSQNDLNDYFNSK